VLAHERQALDVVDVVVQLRHDDQRRVAELVGEVVDGRGVALRQRGELSR
jgi:hypothetical protein